MTDYIDRNNALKEVPEFFTSIDELTDVPFFLKAMPSVDAVEVVRCKDCKHNITGHCAEFARVLPSGQQGGIRYEWHSVNDDDFCKWGEKE